MCVLILAVASPVVILAYFSIPFIVYRRPLRANFIIRMQEAPRKASSDNCYLFFAYMLAVTIEASVSVTLHLTENGNLNVTRTK